MHLRLTKFPPLQAHYTTPPSTINPGFPSSSSLYGPSLLLVVERPPTPSHAGSPAALGSRGHSPPPGHSGSQKPFRQPAVQKQPRPLPEALLPHGALGRELQQGPPALLPVTVATPGQRDSLRRASPVTLQPELYIGPALGHLHASACSSVCPSSINLLVFYVLLGLQCSRVSPRDGPP